MKPKLTTANFTGHRQLPTANFIGVSSRARKYMRRPILVTTVGIAAMFVSLSAQAPTVTPVSAPTDGGYKLVPNWPTQPPDLFFGMKTPPPPPAEREAQAAARRATGGGGGGGNNPNGRPISRASPVSPSISTIAFTCSIAA
jgi:hypothetical protein